MLYMILELPEPQQAHLILSLPPCADVLHRGPVIGPSHNCRACHLAKGLLESEPPCPAGSLLRHPQISSNPKMSKTLIDLTAGTAGGVAQVSSRP